MIETLDVGKPSVISLGAPPRGRADSVTASLRALAQPWTVVLILVLLINDHLLRWRWPSWVTGKLGDVVWLAFAPLVVAVPLAVAIRGAYAVRGLGHRQGRRMAPTPQAGAAPIADGRLALPDLPLWLAIALVGGVFAAAKASPVVAAAFREAFLAVFGWIPLLVSDPTDLLTLPALAGAWALWRRSASLPLVSGRRSVLTARRSVLAGGRPVLTGGRPVLTGGRPVLTGGRPVLTGGRPVLTGGRPVLTGGRPVLTGGRPVLTGLDSRGSGWGTSRAHFPRRAWWVLGLAALATMANSGPPDEGLTCLAPAAAGDGQVLVGAGYQYAYTSTFASEDGGLTWVLLTDEALADGEWQETGETRCVDRGMSWILEDAAMGRQYRFTRAEGVERSGDGGQTWARSLALAGEESRQAYYQATRYAAVGGAGPHDALIDPATGNVIVAMGHEGVLVLPRSGLASEAGAEDAWQWVAVGDYRFEPVTRPDQVFTLLRSEMILALAVTCVAIALCAVRLMKWPGRVFGAITALAILVMVPAARPATVTGYGGAALGMIALGILVVAFLLALFAAIRARGKILPGLGLGLGTGVLFLVPFVLWAVAIIRAYTAAAWIAVLVTVAGWALCATLSRGPAVPSSPTD